MAVGSTSREHLPGMIRFFLLEKIIFGGDGRPFTVIFSFGMVFFFLNVFLGFLVCDERELGTPQTLSSEDE